MGEVGETGMATGPHLHFELQKDGVYLNPVLLCGNRLSAPVSGGFFLLVGWFAAGCGWKTVLLVLWGAVIHEAGHILLLRRFGARIRRLRIGVLGAVLETGGDMSYGRELAAITGGAAGQSAGGGDSGAAGLFCGSRRQRGALHL